MLNKFTTTFIGAAFAASSAAAQENFDTVAPEMPHEVTVYQDETLRIIAPLNALDEANNFSLMCPGYPMRDFYSEKTNDAVMLIYNTSRVLATEALANYRLMQPNFVGPDDTYATINSGFINTDNSLVLAYTFNQYVEALEDYIAQPDPLPAARLENPNLFKTLRKHADNFCFSNF